MKTMKRISNLWLR